MTDGYSDRREGFSLVEMVIALSFLIVLLAGMALAVNMGIRTSRDIREDTVALSMSQSLVDRLCRIPFGSPGDPDPTSSELGELFDNDLDFGTITLTQLSRFPSADGGWRFSLSDSPVEGEWRVRVDCDLNGDGMVMGSFEDDGSEIFRIQVWYDDRLILETIRRNELSGS